MATAAISGDPPVPPNRARRGSGTDIAHRVVKPIEALLKRQCRQEAGQLNAGLRDPQFVEKH